METTRRGFFAFAGGAAAAAVAGRAEARNLTPAVGSTSAVSTGSLAGTNLKTKLTSQNSSLTVAGTTFQSKVNVTAKTGVNGQATAEFQQDVDQSKVKTKLSSGAGGYTGVQFDQSLNNADVSANLKSGKVTGTTQFLVEGTTTGSKVTVNAKSGTNLVGTGDVNSSKVTANLSGQLNEVGLGNITGSRVTIDAGSPSVPTQRSNAVVPGLTQ